MKEELNYKTEEMIEMQILNKIKVLRYKVGITYVNFLTLILSTKVQNKFVTGTYL